MKKTGDLRSRAWQRPPRADNLWMDLNAHNNLEPIPAMCRGLAHELNNVLTYLLPTIKEVGCFHGDVIRTLSTPSGEHPDLPFDEGLVADVERMNRQLHLGGARLSQFCRDLRLGFVAPLQERLMAVDLRQALLIAAEAAPRGQAFTLLEPPSSPQGPLWVWADPALLEEAMGRLLRAALGWAQTVQLGYPVQVSLSPLPSAEGSWGMVRIEALLPGEGDGERLPSPEDLLQMLCPSESGAIRAERGPLGVLVGIHLFRAHGGGLFAVREPRGVVLCGELPLLSSHS